MNKEKKYVIKKHPYSKDSWDNIEQIKIDCFKWVDNNYMPAVYAKLFHDNVNIYIRFEAFEDEITVKHIKDNEDVCEDSCVEFFFGPWGKEEYFNFEVNAQGVLLSGIGKDRYDRRQVIRNREEFCIKSSVGNAEDYHEDFWSVEYRIPFEFIRSYFEDFCSQKGLAVNLYKCGDKTKYEHYGMWSEIFTDNPDFHQRKFFGKMEFEV